MTLENLEKANELQSQIKFLETKIQSFNPENKCVYLDVKDHHGNKRDVIETYFLGDMYVKSAGYAFKNFIADAYAEFLKKVRDEMQKRIIYLQNELNNL
ncbi:MAG: hypothetical protein WC401_07260 [Bacteroidales bacterium]